MKKTIEVGMDRGEMIAGSDACARGIEMVAYLYGEATPREARDFENHLGQCATCRAEFSTFGKVREGIQDWRDRSIGSSFLGTHTGASAADVTSPAGAPRRSALAAIREFFTLSPDWLRVATVAASLAFSIFVVIAAGRLFQKTQSVAVTKTQAVPAGAQTPVVARVNPPAPAAVAPPEGSGPSEKLAGGHPPVTRRSRVTQAVYRAPAARQFSAPVRSVQASPRELQQIARDLRLIPASDEEELPRLSDLDDDSN